MRTIRQTIRALLDRQFVRFLLVGGLNTLFSYLVYAALIFLGVNFALANLGAVLLGILFSFKTQGALVFNNSNYRLLLKYGLLWLVIYACNAGLIKLMIGAGFSAYAAGALAVPPIVFLSFALQKYGVFKNRSAS